MKKVLSTLLVIGLFAANIGNWPINTIAGGDSLMGLIEEYMDANFMRSTNPTFTGTMTQTGGGFSVDSDGTIRAPRIVFAPQDSLDDLGYEEGATIYLREPAMIGIGGTGGWELCPLIPEDEWTVGMIAEVVLRGADGKRYIATTDSWIIQ